MIYGTKKDIRHNLFLFFADNTAFQPAMTLISITAVIPFFLEQLGASTMQTAMAASITFICSFVSQPFFGSIASHSKKLNKTFGNILLLQRVIFLAFILSMPLFSGNHALLVWLFLFFWGVFNIFVGSYSVFFTPLMLKLLPPNRRGLIRGLGFALGSALGVGMASLIPAILRSVSFPGNYTLVFSLGIVFLLIDVILFFLMREHEDIEPRIPMGIIQYLKGIPVSIMENARFRAMILTCMFLITANSLLAYYALYAIRVFQASESHIAALAALAVISNAAGQVCFGFIIDRRGPKTTSIIAAILVISAGLLALSTNSLNLFFAAWILANLANSSTEMTVAMFLGEVSPPPKLPLYVGVNTTISLALSSAVLLLLAPVLEHVGFKLLFVAIFACGSLSLAFNLFVLRKFDNFIQTGLK